MNAPRPPAKPPNRRWLLAGLAALLALAAGVALFRTSQPPLPIPVPPGIQTLDPQVRAHLAKLADSIAQAPRDAERRADMGLAFAVNGLWPEARQCFTNAQQLGNSGPLPAMYAAVANQEMGDYEGAIRELREVVRLHPDFAPAWHRLGHAFIASGQPAAAVETFTAVTRLAPRDWHGWAGLGEAQLRSGQGPAAVESLTQANQLDPATRSIHFLLGQAYQAVGRTNEARAELAAGGTQSLSPMPDPWSVRAIDHMKSLPDQFERADILVARGEFEEAIGRLKEALRFHPTNSAVIASLGRALNGGSKPDAAWELLSRAMQRTPDDVALLVVAVDSAAALDRTNEALALASRALELAPQSAEVHIAHANALLALGNDAAAVTSLRRALDLAPRDIGLWVQLGDTLQHNLKSPDDAIAAYRQGHQTDPLHASPLLALTTLFLEQGRTREAEDSLAQLRKLPLDPAILRNLERRFREATTHR